MNAKKIYSLKYITTINRMLGLNVHGHDLRSGDRHIHMFRRKRDRGFSVDGKTSIVFHGLQHICHGERNGRQILALHHGLRHRRQQGCIQQIVRMHLIQPRNGCAQS